MPRNCSFMCFIQDHTTSWGFLTIYWTILLFVSFLLHFSLKSGLIFGYLGVQVLKKILYMKIFLYFMISCQNYVLYNAKPIISITKSFIFKSIMWLCTFFVILDLRIHFFRFVSDIFVNTWKVNCCWQSCQKLYYTSFSSAFPWD